ncbi:ricin-type beta-trefoil lectin domain protein [Streptomyces sp. TRM S81-3]|uniref:Ricin-type beta-trefoil lectin domain protein n=1 Tax=Streptomyces griseicoloratus TaxID=2752516 RepID=A0A926L4M2_9ACTN|nr:ricin-type beta-trefoil lectin domain protein [Streptomyces griseicoloratus]
MLENVARPGFVLDNDAGGGQDSSVLAHDRNGGANQLWEVSPDGGNPVQIKQRIGGQELCAAAVFNGVADVSMQPCDGSGGVVRWHEIRVGENRYVYRNVSQGTCIAATRANGPVDLVECAFGDQDQQWVKRVG